MGGNTVLISPPNSINLTPGNAPSTIIGVTPANISTGLPLIQTLTQLIQIPLPTNSGGTGLNIPIGSIGPGQLLMGSGGGFALANLTPGSNITISNLNGGIVISASGLQQPITIPITINSGGTGLNTPIGSITNGQLLIGNTGGYSLGNITSSSNNLSVTNNAGNININTSGLQQAMTIPVTINSGGTGLNIPVGSVSGGQLLVGSGGGFSLSTLNPGNNILITNQNGTITIAATGLQPNISIPITTNSGGTGLNIPVGSISAGQLLVGSGGGFALANLIPGSNISITNNNGAITVSTIGLQSPITIPITTNSGGTGLSIPVGSVGAGQLLVGSGGGFTLSTLQAGSNVSIINQNGTVTISATGLEPLITIPITINSGGTGLNTPIGSVPNGALLIGSGGGWNVGGLQAGSNISIASGAGILNIGSTVIYPLGVTSGGTGLSSTTTAGQLLVGSGGGYALSNLQTSPNMSVINQQGTITINSNSLRWDQLTNPTANLSLSMDLSGVNPLTTFNYQNTGDMMRWQYQGTNLIDFRTDMINSYESIRVQDNQVFSSANAITLGPDSIQGHVHAFGNMSIDAGGSDPLNIQPSGTGNVQFGNSQQLIINNSGNITKLNNVTTSFPSSQGSANTILKNDGSGNLSWSTNYQSPITIPLPINSGGTGLSTTIGSVSNGNILIGSGGGYNVGPITGGTNISITNGPGTILITDTATASSYINFPLATNSGGTGLNIPVGSTTAGQLLVGSGGGFSLSTIQPGNNVTVTNQQGTITVGTTGLQSTIGIPLAINSGGTGISTPVGTVPDGAIFVGSGGGWTVEELEAGANMSVVSGAGILQVASTVVYPLGVTSGGTGIGTIPTSGQLLVGSGGGYSLSTLNPGTNVTITSTDGTVTVNAPNAAAKSPSGQVQYASGSAGAFGSSPNFFWDAVNNKLGIKNNTPAGGLDISGPISGGPNATGPYLGLSSSIYTDNVTPSGGTGGSIAFNTIGIPIATTTSGSVTQTSNTTLTIVGSPQISGTNNTVTNSIGLLISSGSGSISAAGNTTSNSFSLIVYPQTGATNNYNTIFVTGNVGMQKSQPRSGVEFGNSIAVNRTSVADTNYTVLGSDYIVAYTTLTAARTVTLVSAAFINSRIYIIKDEAGTASTNNITVQGSTGTQKIDGATTAVINTNYGMLEIYAFASNWYILNKR